MLKIIELQTPPKESLIDITAQVRHIARETGIQEGLCVAIVPHTTAAITVNSALDAATSQDIIADIRRLVPTRLDFLHQYDTPADAAAHIKATLVGHSINLIVTGGDLLIGGSQSILFYEFDGPRSRRVQVKVLGES